MSQWSSTGICIYLHCRHELLYDKLSLTSTHTHVRDSCTMYRDIRDILWPMERFEKRFVYLLIALSVRTKRWNHRKTNAGNDVLMIFRARTVILWESIEHEKFKIAPKFIQWLESRKVVVVVPAFSYQHARRKGEKWNFNEAILKQWYIFLLFSLEGESAST